MKTFKITSNGNLLSYFISSTPQAKKKAREYAKVFNNVILSNSSDVINY